MSPFARRLMWGVSGNVWTPAVLWAQAAKQQRPTGAGYVRYEDIYVSGDTLQQTCNRVPADGNGDPQILTLPAGTFTLNGMSGSPPCGLRIGSGYAVNCCGIVGSGRNTIIKLLTNTTSDSGNRIYGTMIRVQSVPNAVMSNFQLQAEYQSDGSGQLYGAGIIMVSCPGTEISWLYLRGASPGYADTPPGETFGINIYKSDNTTIHDCEVDGRDLSGVRQCASPIGWNGSGTYPNITFVKNARVYRTYVHHGKVSMPTFWYTQNIYTEDYWSFSTGSGSGGALRGHAMNHEQDKGPITHVRPHFFVHNQNSTGIAPPYPLPDDTRTTNSGMNFSLLTTIDDLGASTTIIEPVWDKAWSGTGPLIMAAYDGYDDNQGLGDTSALVTPPKIIKNGVQLIASNKPADSSWNNRDPAVYFVWLHS